MWRDRTTGIRRGVVVCVAAGLVSIALPAAAHAQDTRAGVIAAEQDKKAANLRPMGPGRAEQVFIRLREGTLEEPSGPYPYFDSVYSGGGFTLGGGYRQFVGDNTFFDVRGLYSLKAYKMVETGVMSHGLASRRVDASVYVGWRDATQVGFYGLGIDSVPDDRANLRFKETYVTGALAYRPIPWVVLRGGLALDDYNTAPGKGSYPSIEERYDEATAPGAQSNPTYWHTQAGAAIDWRTSPGYSRTGGLYGVTLHNWADVDDAYSFKQAQVDLVQHIPILRETWVISLRGRLQTTLGDDSNTPIFLLPSLGGGSTLRGYNSWRFRDKHSVLTSAEWRWIPNRLGLDFAIFYDAGHVAPTRDALMLNRFKGNWGIGARFHSPLATPLRIELARGSEGFSLVFSGNAAF